MQLQSISQVVSTSYAGGFNGLDGRKSGNVGHGQLDAPQPALIDDAASVCESSVETDLRRVTRTTCANTLPVKITTSVTTLRCPHRCPCQCHKRSHIRTSPWFKAIIGQMLFSYHSLIRTTPCDYQPCRETPDKTPRKTEFVYYFPHWLAWRALIVSSTSKTLGPGPSVLIDFPIVLPYGNPIFSAVRRGNIPFLQQLFGRGYNPHIVDKFGMSLALVRTNTPLRFPFLLLRTNSIGFASKVVSETEWYMSNRLRPAALLCVQRKLYGIVLTGRNPGCRHM